MAQIYLFFTLMQINKLHYYNIRKVFLFEEVHIMTSVTKNKMMQDNLKTNSESSSVCAGNKII